MLRSERRKIFGPQKRRKTETDDICFTYGKNGEGKGGQSLGRRKTSLWAYTETELIR